MMSKHNGLRKAIDYLTFLLVLAIGSHLYEYGAAIPLTNGSADVQAIKTTVAHDIAYMDADGERRPGDGVFNGMVNNFETWFTTYKGCTGQSDKVASDLQVAFPDWQFQVVASPVHHWILAYHGDTVLRIDPWTGEVSKQI